MKITNSYKNNMTSINSSLRFINMNGVTDYNANEFPKHLLKAAKKELHEDQWTREQSLQQLRNWLSKNMDILNMRCDDGFLLRFLRAKKFNVPLAQQSILKYLNIKRTFPHLSTQLDLLDAKLNDIISSGYIFATPKRDKNGRRVVIVNAKGFNAKLYGSSEQAKVHFLTYEFLMEDPLTQMVGVTHIGNFSGVTTHHITNWKPGEFARVFKWGEQSLPMRHKEIHLINLPSGLKWLVEFAKTRVSLKIRKRLTVHSNAEELCKAIDPECLPQELGGRMSTEEMLKLWKCELLEKRETILKLDEITLLTDCGIQCKKSGKLKNVAHFLKHYECLEGSFRKLEID
ncbi:retinaldehyde-binding protein 1 isoform X1 [Glossina fuscipes]|uniref:Retinaldehyde-binding protein 1 isoform X1 n=2 Tax=Glossina fuscipes TaxID=7396 RepID=A0A8U0W366_9MUSC|nr:retinaldehyde-binding protein 1 isoform X1 [Glossina fuscipes]